MFLSAVGDERGDAASTPSPVTNLNFIGHRYRCKALTGKWHKYEHTLSYLSSMPDHDDGNQGGSEQKYKWLFEIPRVRPPWMLTTSKSYGLFAFFLGSHSPMVPALLNGLRINIKKAFSLKVFLTLVQISLPPPWLQTEWTQRFPLPRVVQSRRGGAEGSHCRVLMEKSARHEWRGDLRQLLRLGRKTRAKAQHMEGIFVQQSSFYLVSTFIPHVLSDGSSFKYVCLEV